MDSAHDALAARGMALFAAGRVAEALTLFEDLVTRDSSRASHWFNLGLLRRRAGRSEAALAAYAQALATRISDAHEVHLNRAVIYAEDFDDPEAARGALDMALSLAPDWAPAWLNLGNLHEDNGARAEAATAYRRALDLEPGNRLALARLAGVTRFSSRHDPLIGRLEATLAEPGTDPLHQADIGFALGRALDEVGDFASAFAAYTEANRASAKLAGRSYDPRMQAAMVDKIIACFDEGGAVGSGTALEQPIFICGMTRSGSTLAERILSAHPALHAGGELALVPQLAGSLRPWPAAAASLTDEQARGLADRYRVEVQKRGLGLSGLIDKRPENFVHVGLIKRMFPEARIVHTRRARADTVLSMYFAHLDPRQTHAQSLEAAAHWYDQQERLFDHWKALFPGSIHTLDYDALVADPRAEIEALLAFLDLEFADACLAPHAGGGQVRTASAWQVREPLYAKSSGRWRNYAAWLPEGLI